MFPCKESCYGVSTMLKCSFFSVSRTEGLLTNPLYNACAELSLNARHLLDAVNNIVVSIFTLWKIFFCRSSDDFKYNYFSEVVLWH